MNLLEEVLEAHGGVERWSTTKRITARERVGGLLPRTRMPGNRFADAKVTVDVDERRVSFDPFPGPGRIGVFEPGQVRIETADGEVLESRIDPRRSFSGLAGLRRNLRWDALDAAYFAGYAMWNYLTTPLLLTRQGVEVREGGPWRESGEPWRRLEVSFAPGLDTHSARQTFYVDAGGLIRRHDYTAEVVSGWARAAHYVDGHREFDGLVFPTRRRVVPRGRRNRSLRGPTLVWIELDEVSVESG